MAIAMLVALSAAGHAAAPDSGSLSPSSTSVSWNGGLIAGATLNESGCTEGVTCETYTLTLLPGDYTGKRITLGIDWIVPANDVDMYVHANTLSGTVVATSNGPPPGTSELTSIAINPSIVGTAKVYVVHVVSASVAPGEMYTGHAEISDVAAPRTATYLEGNLRFSQNVALRAPVTTSDGEPSIRVDVRGNCYVSGIRGVPAGVDLWRFDLNPTSPTFDPGMQNPTYLGQPDAFVPQDPGDPTTGGADGGGDIDIACSFPADALSTPVVTMVSLAAANISSAVSTNKGASFTLSPVVAAVPVDDRQWCEADGPSTVYLMYRAPLPATGLFVQRSDDNGLTYPITSLVNPQGTSPGYIDVDHTNHRVYVSHQSSALTVASSADMGLTWKNNTVDNSTDHGTMFDVVKVGDDGTVYALWSDQHDIYLAHSTNGGILWSDKVRVNSPAFQTNLMPWFEAGSAGRLAIVWYGSTSPTNDDNADWNVVFSQTLDATANSPTFRQQVISDHVIHGSNISLGGLTGAANRNLIDLFQVALDPQGAAVVAFTDDHNDFNGHTYVTRQLDGTSLYASANGNGTVTPAFPPPLPLPDPVQPEVMDFLHDATGALIQPVPEDSPFDILSIDYSMQPYADPLLVCTMHVSDLPADVRGANWRMNFTANAPGGLSDRGDQFWVMATTDTGAIGVAPEFKYGTATRNSNGSINYVVQGDADFGQFDTANDRVVLKVAFSKLNALITHGPAIGAGSVLHGLRGSTFTTTVCTPDDLPLQQCRGAIRDQTRGGTRFVVRGQTTGVEVPTPAATTTFLRGPSPNPTQGRAAVEFRLGRAGFAELAVFDVHGRRVRTIQAGNLAAGVYTREWDGQTDRFSPAPDGMYFVVLHTADGRLSQRVALAR